MWQRLISLSYILPTTVAYCRICSESKERILVTVVVTVVCLRFVGEIVAEILWDFLQFFVRSSRLYTLLSNRRWWWWCFCRPRLLYNLGYDATNHSCCNNSCSEENPDPPICKAYIGLKQATMDPIVQSAKSRQITITNMLWANKFRKYMRLCACEFILSL